MVNDYNAGKNYFLLLDVDRSASDADLRRAFRKLSVTMHPDKVGKQGEKAYFDLVRANEILTDPEARKEYENLLDEGVPWQVQYYGKYAHKYGAPDHDVRYVLLGLVAMISVGQYLYQWYKHIWYTGLAKKTNRYKQAIKAQQKGGRKKKSKDSDDEEDEEEDLEVFVRGAEKPELKNIFAIHVVLFPFYLLRAIFYVFRFVIWYKLLGKPQENIDQEKAMREKLGMSEEEYAYEKQRAEERQQKMMDSVRYKRYQRWLRKNR